MANYPTPAVAWLQITKYMHEWLINEFGGNVRLHNKPVLTVTYLPGVKKVLRMETMDDVTDISDNKFSMSAMRMDCVTLGCSIGPKTMQEQYGITPELLDTYLPIECPRMALTKYGVLRPWARNMAFGKQQAIELLTLLRNAFWDNVNEYYHNLIDKGEAPETAIELIRTYCEENHISEVHLDDLRREWQRLLKIKRYQKKTHVNLC